MEARKITIVSTKNQEKSVIMSSATTLGELKRDLDSANIDYQDMVFYEGVSKTELINNDSVLPHDIPYKGQTTNELVFMLTVPNKKIRSGAMNRKEIYALIKEYNLQKVCLEEYKKDYTRCKSEDLLKLIEYHRYAPKQSAETVGPNDELMKKVKNLEVAVELISDSLREESVITNAKFWEIMKHIVPSFEPAELNKVNSSYTDDEIDEMFKFI